MFFCHHDKVLSPDSDLVQEKGLLIKGVQERCLVFSGFFMGDHIHGVWEERLDFFILDLVLITIHSRKVLSHTILLHYLSWPILRACSSISHHITDSCLLKFAGLCKCTILPQRSKIYSIVLWLICQDSKKKRTGNKKPIICWFPNVIFQIKCHFELQKC